MNNLNDRFGSINVDIEIWNSDIHKFLNTMQKGVVYLLIPDLFIERLEKKEKWSLMCGKECSDLLNSYENDFKQKYGIYEKNNKIIKTIDPEDLMRDIFNSQLHTGRPIIKFKDVIYRKDIFNSQIHTGSPITTFGDTIHKKYSIKIY